MSYESLGKRISDARKEKGFTQAEIATKLNVTAQNVSSWERGKSKIDIDTLAYLCELYDINVSEILQHFFEGDKEPALPKPDANTDPHLQKYHLLNEDGKVKVDERIEELLEVPKYRADGEPEPTHGRGKPIPSLLRDHNENKSKNTG